MMMYETRTCTCVEKPLDEFIKAEPDACEQKLAVQPGRQPLERRPHSLLLDDLDDRLKAAAVLLHAIASNSDQLSVSMQEIH